MMTSDDEMMTSKGPRDIFSKILIFGGRWRRAGEGSEENQDLYSVVYFFIKRRAYFHHACHLYF